ncbi:hypothetical protein [Azospirillum halopraeferens]|uniref:hypothetical protein n=1 Tax=Azospirillum halopraeferens TaxID=34010 RepID=UPI00048AABE1|nr:hypothetical protein [Azospirillum halopraeferens]
MTAPVHLVLSITVHGDDDGGVPVLQVVGLPDAPEVWAVVDDAGAVRSLWRVRGVPARLPEQPIAPHLPSVAALCRGALA